MEAVGAAGAIIGVVQFGLQFSQVLVTVIGDYKDAAKNVNRLRDEIHLTSICLKQLGDLASQDRLRKHGILEATELRERCHAVFWEIRRKIQKGDTPLHPTNITKDQIDVSHFRALRWATLTKMQLEEPRRELDRLKNSMTLCFVSHMAILSSTDLEQRSYAAQIPGIKRTLVWSRGYSDDDPVRKRLLDFGLSNREIAQILGGDDDDEDVDENEHLDNINHSDDGNNLSDIAEVEEVTDAGVANDAGRAEHVTHDTADAKSAEEKDAEVAKDGLDSYPPEQSLYASDAQTLNVTRPTANLEGQKPNKAAYRPMLKVWSIHPPANTCEVPVSEEWMKRYVEQDDIGDRDILRIQSKLHPWFKNELNTMYYSQSEDSNNIWSIVAIKPVYNHRFSRGAPQSVQVVLKSSPKPPANDDEIEELIRLKALKAGWSDEYVEELIRQPHETLTTFGTNKHHHHHHHVRSRDAGEAEDYLKQHITHGYTKETQDALKKQEDSVDTGRPTYIRINLRYILPETLNAFGLNWYYEDEDHIVIKQYIDHDFQRRLFAHTRKLRASRKASREKDKVAEETDEEIIAQQLALYQ